MPTAAPAALRLRACVAGIDLLFRVQSRDLLSVRLEGGRVDVDRRALAPGAAGAVPREVLLQIGASVEDVVARDLRVRF